MSADFLFLVLPLLALFVSSGLWWSYHQIMIDRTISRMNEVRRNVLRPLTEQLYAGDKELLETKKALEKECQYNAAAQERIDDLTHALQDVEEDLKVAYRSYTELAEKAAPKKRARKAKS